MANEIDLFLPAQHAIATAAAAAAAAAALAASDITAKSGMQLKDIAKVLVPNSAVFGVVTFSQVEMTLKITLLVLSVVYTTLHIVFLWRKLRSKKIESDPDI